MRLRAALDGSVGAVLAVLMAVAVVNVGWQVFSRFVLESPSSYTDELARYLLVWIGLLGAAHAGGQRLHVAVDLVPRSLGRPTERALDGVVQGAILLFAVGVLVGGGGRLVALSFELGQRSAALGLPMGFVYLALPFAGAVLALHAVLEIASGAGAVRRSPR